MVKLTEDMVVARSKGSELYCIKKLNCWGSELTNVSVVRRLPNVEVLSLSVNQISTLEDFQYCPNLQELYIRKNNINDINEVLYLKNIPKLKSVWLADNPCAEFDEYRMTVIRALPHLQKLDNVVVENEEVQQAMVTGLHLPLPDSSFKNEETTPTMPRSNSVGNSLRSESRCDSGGSLSDTSPTAFPISQNEPAQVDKKYNTSLEEGFEYTQNVYDEDEEHPQMRKSSSHQSFTSNGGRREVPVDPGTKSPTTDNYVNPRRQSHGPPITPSSECEQPPPRCEQPPPSVRPISRTSSEYGYNHNEEPPYQYSRYPQPPHKETPKIALVENNNNNVKTERTFRRTSCSREQSWASDLDGYHRGDQYGPNSTEVVYRQQRPSDSYAGRPTSDYRSPGEKWHFGPRPSSVGEVVQHHYENTYRKVDQQIENAGRVANSLEKASPNRPYPLRPKTRNGNVMSAVLCLIKELDYSSLEVVEMAIRCRMEELDD